MTFVQEGPAPPPTGDPDVDAARNAAARATLERQGRRAVGVSTEWAVHAGRMREGQAWLRRTSPWFGTPEADADRLAALERSLREGRAMLLAEGPLEGGEALGVGLGRAEPGTGAAQPVLALAHAIDADRPFRRRADCAPALPLERRAGGGVERGVARRVAGLRRRRPLLDPVPGFKGVGSSERSF